MLSLERCITALFPPLCVHCDHEGSWLCSTAQARLVAEPVGVDPLSIPGVDTVVVRGSYDCPPLAAIIQKLKYHYWTGLRDIVAECWRPVLPHLLVDPAAVIIPVPLHARRQRERGFNQSHILGTEVSALLGRPIRPLLDRHRYTAPQARLSAARRTANVVGAFGLRDIDRWPSVAVLVDDVITTGSTIAECAAMLRRHEVKHIVALALAKG